MQYRATALVLAAVAACGLGCGENVLVSSWQLGLKSGDAGAGDPAEVDFPNDRADAGSKNFSAINAQSARAHLKKKEGKGDGQHAGDNSSDNDDKSSH